MSRVIIKQNVGLDVSKDDFKVSFRQMDINQEDRIKGSRTFKNTLSGFGFLIKWIDKHKSANIAVRITLEATGVYYEQLVHYLKDHSDYYISVVLPNKAKSYFKSLNLKSKTDKLDAKALGQMGLERNLSKWEPLSPKMLKLKQLTRERVSILGQKTALSNRLHALNHSYNPSKKVIKRILEQLKLLKKQLKSVDKEIEFLVEKDEVLSVHVDNICKAKGLGIVTVASILAETGGFELFSSRSQVISFAGYDVVQRESGSSVRGKTRISKKGNRYIRRALHFPAVVVIKYDKKFKQLYERVYERTKIKMKALVAVQRKLLLLIYALVKKKEAYNPGYGIEQLNENLI